MKSRLLWDRFLAFWLPPGERTGDVERDIRRALGRTYSGADGRQATFGQKGGRSTVVVDPKTTWVASRIPPNRDTPQWLDWRSGMAAPEQNALLDSAIRDLLARPRPHVILKTRRQLFAPDRIVLGEGTVVVVNEPDRTTMTDSVRVCRARRALKVLRSARRAADARRLLDDRSVGSGDVGAVDQEIEAMIAKLKIDRATFFDALDLLDGVTPAELTLASRTP